MEDIFKKRRAVREFKPGIIKKQMLKKIFLAGSYAPSGRDKHPLGFVVVKDRQLKWKLAKAQIVGTRFVRGAETVIVVCANPKQSGTWLEDSSIAAAYMWLKCAQLGLGACWAHVRVVPGKDGLRNKRGEACTRKLLKIPEYMRIVCLLAIGYPPRNYPVHSERELLDKIYYNFWDKPYF